MAGRWSGTMQPTAEAVRKVQLTLRATGSRLDGSFSSSSGAISADVPLESGSYENGTLTFVITLGGRPLKFSGKVDGRAVQGTIESGGKPAGQFSLRWVD